MVPVVPITDTLREDHGKTVDRNRFVAVQTPQGFKRDVLVKAHESKVDATDDVALVDKVGGSVVQVEGEVSNVKITMAIDLKIAEVHLHG